MNKSALGLNPIAMKSRMILWYIYIYIYFLNISYGIFWRPKNINKHFKVWWEWINRLSIYMIELHRRNVVPDLRQVITNSRRWSRMCPDNDKNECNSYVFWFTWHAVSGIGRTFQFQVVTINIFVGASNSYEMNVRESSRIWESRMALH